ERELHVARRQRLAVVPLDALSQEEDEVAIAVLPRPLLRQLAHHRLGRLRRLHGIEVDEVVEAGRRGPHGGDRRGLVDREPLRQLFPLHDVQNAAVLRHLTHRRWHRRRAGQKKHSEREPPPPHPALRASVIAAAPMKGGPPPPFYLERARLLRAYQKVRPVRSYLAGSEEHGEILGQEHVLVEDDLAPGDAPVPVLAPEQILAPADED